MKEDILHNRGFITLLEELGLSGNEIKCYLATLGLNSATVAEISSHAAVNRVNAYSAVKKLLEHGLLEQEITPKGRRIRPAPFDALQELAQSYQKHATRLRWKMEDLIKELTDQRAQNNPSQPTIMGEVLFFRGEDAFYQIAERTLAIPPGSEVCILEAFDYFTPPDNPTYDDEYYIPARLNRGVSARILHRPDEHGRALRARDHKEHRETRFLPTNMNFPCSMYIYGDEVALVWTTDHVVGLAVRGGPLTTLMRAMFEQYWKAAAAGNLYRDAKNAPKSEL
ncbi:hypothetical protein HYW17_05270 [Candidatus Uhrbacteria bacterium]|nr:hypothetical protein [Candidatus Uhrbacteria bacterium]